jgi:hypothetical protein
MDDTPHHGRQTDWDPPVPAEADLLAALTDSEAEAEAGLFVSGDEVLRELHESITRMEGRTAAAGTSGSPRRR